MSDAVKFFEEGYNCAEAVIKAVNEEKKLNIPVSVGTPFGSGMSVGSTCGAIAGAIIALGAIKGRETYMEPNEARSSSKEILKNIKEKYGTLECKELKRKGVSCKEIVNYAYNILNEYI
ncbi:C-GCAxxG-C-C family protein [Clostridium aestuarii]|uniref:C-GCAxxG-C-C family protein n=1 Tax=Clostridium aestuarii TaxID=338193 RepID=A0ABT4D4L8_9CLOT|nr:C-GCAxxG-C-C family (seleno)protein [Clostridium aestuarii]MCY6484988.1 C-GCAxxG-C-C family protein [Clostridium aestuarii]